MSAILDKSTGLCLVLQQVDEVRETVNHAVVKPRPRRRACDVMLLTARPPSRSSSSPRPKHLTPLTPASARKNKNKRSRPLAADEHSKQSAVRTNQQREVWVRSPSPAVGSPAGQQRSQDRSLSPGAGSLDQRSRSPAAGSLGQRSRSPAVGSLGQRSRSPAVGSLGQRSRSPAAGSLGQRSRSPAAGSLGQRSMAAGQRSNNADGERGSAMFTRRSSSLSNVQTQQTTHVQHTYVICFLLFIIYYIIIQCSEWHGGATGRALNLR